MLGEDKARVYKAFHRLLLVLPHRWKTDKQKADAFEVYLDSLKELSVEAIEHGERTLRIEGTIDNWFPTPPEWFDAAAELEVKLLARPVAGLLQPAPEELERELEATRGARDSFVEECRQLGREGLAEFFEALPVRHPSEDPDRPYCADCVDTGMRSQGDGASPCGCVTSNPRIRAQALRHQRLSRLKRRHHRAAALTPARNQKELSHI
jgi:hypothetical protein